MNITMLRGLVCKFVRLLFGRRCISIKGEARVPLCFPPAEYPSLLLGVKKYIPKVRWNWAHLLSDDEVILDIGANIGVTVQRFFSILDGRCHIWAFEPDPRNFELLKINSRVLCFDRICLINSAVGDYDGEAIFHNNINHGALSRIASVPTVLDRRWQGYWKKYTEIKVKMVTLDTFLKNHIDVRPTFVKIDVEGSGTMVLKGAKDMLKWYKPVLSCEFHLNEQIGMSQILQEAGYRGVVFHGDGELSWCDPGDSKGDFVHPADPRVVRLNIRDSSKLT